MKKLQSLLFECSSMLADQEVADCLDYLFEEDTRPFPPHARAFRDHKIIHRRIEFLLANDSKRGRPSPVEQLKGYVTELAKLYIQITGKNFSIFRHASESPDGERRFAPVTAAHRFVSVAVDHVNREAKREGSSVIYTDKNIYNACEAVQKNF